jgi:ABC-type antimicrobial peptide transport system permease subunit
MNQVVAKASAERRFQTFLPAMFGGIALFLSLVGLYGWMAYSVQQRTAEIGIRIALGAQPGNVMRLVLKPGSGLAVTGIALGFAGVWCVTRLMTSLLFEVKPTDTLTFFGVAILFCAVALAACYVPALVPPASIPWWRCATNSIRQKWTTRVAYCIESE